MPRRNNGSPLDDINRDHEWMCTQDLAKFAGEWIAVFDKAIIAHDQDLRALMAKIKTISPTRKPLLVQIPDKPISVF